ncbi:hypothetical protein pb186bvf_017499 [Paramecium bursaria]
MTCFLKDRRFLEMKLFYTKKIFKKLKIFLRNTLFFLLGLKKYQDAIQNCDKAIKFDPKDIFAYECKGINIQHYKGSCLYGLEQFDEAFQAYDYRKKQSHYIKQNNFNIKNKTIRIKQICNLMIITQKFNMQYIFIFCIMITFQKLKKI